MDESPAGVKAGPRHYVLNTRPLLNFTYTDRVDLLERLLEKPIYVPAEVHEEWQRARLALERKLRDLPAHRHDPLDVQLLAHLDQARGRFRGNPFRVVRLQGEELELADELQERQWLSIDPGEADVLALCIQRGPGWMAVLDDRPAHDFAVANNIPTVGTIELLLEAVKQDLLSLSQGEHLLGEMRLSWPRAPGGKLKDHSSGHRSIW
jgi:predicted nucleic acid-binding protein